MRLKTVPSTLTVESSTAPRCSRLNLTASVSGTGVIQMLSSLKPTTRCSPSPQRFEAFRFESFALTPASYTWAAPLTCTSIGSMLRPTFGFKRVKLHARLIFRPGGFVSRSHHLVRFISTLGGRWFLSAPHIRFPTIGSSCWCFAMPSATSHLLPAEHLSK